MSERTLDHRLEERAKFACVVRAIHAKTPASRRGKRSKCWSLPMSTLSRVAEMVCIRHATLDEVLAELKKELKGIDRSSLNRWLKPIVAAYETELNRADLHDEATLDVAVHDGDLVAQVAVVWSAATLMLARYINTVDWNDLDNNTKHTLLRFLEASTDAAKVQAQAKEHEAKTQRILLQVKATLAEASGKPKADMAKAYAVAFAQIDELLGLGGARA